MRSAFIVTIVIGIAIVVGWYVFEHFWDRKLFLSETTSNLDTTEAREWLVETKNVQIVDVRPAVSYQNGHLPGAMNVKYVGGELDSSTAEKLDTDKPVLIYCDGGFRSRMAISAFEDAGFKEISHLHRGIMAWKMKGGEVEKD